jgi:hypothetical protein
MGFTPLGVARKLFTCIVARPSSLTHLSQCFVEVPRTERLLDLQVLGDHLRELPRNLDVIVNVTLLEEGTPSTVVSARQGYEDALVEIRDKLGRIERMLSGLSTVRIESASGKAS